MAQQPHKWTSAEDDILRRGYTSERPGREIAAEIGVSRTCMQRRASALGLSSTRTGTRAATAARVVDSRARMAAAAERELKILELQQTQYLTGLTGEGWETRNRDGDTKKLRFIPADEGRSASQARESSSRIVRNLTPDDDSQRSAAESFIDKLAAGLGLDTGGAS